MTFNPFGPSLDASKIDELLDSSKTDAVLASRRQALAIFFELPWAGITHPMLTRYAELTESVGHTNIGSADWTIQERLIKPLASARRMYAYGEYLASIALCGLVGEMLAVLVWRMRRLAIRGNPVTKEQEIALFGKSWERLPQGRRIQALRGLEFIGEDQKTRLSAVQNTRNNYLHSWRLSTEEAQGDAKLVFNHDMSVFQSIAWIRLATPGLVEVNPQLRGYLEREAREVGGSR